MAYTELLRYKLKGFKMSLDREEALGTNHSLSHSLRKELELCHPQILDRGRCEGTLAYGLLQKRERLSFFLQVFELMG